MTWAEVLSESVEVGPVTVANRLSIAPHTVNFGIDSGEVDDSFVAYLARRAAGFGLTIVPLAAPAPSGRAEPSQPWLWDDRWIPQVARIADAVRAAGSEPGLQINHAGRQTNTAILGGEQPVAPSAVPARSIYKNPPRELTTGEIGGLIESYAACASRAVRAGYRWINLHFAHGYLVSQFLSADSNQREDQYGGSLENRSRFGLETVQAIRAEVGQDVVIDVRMNGRDFVEGGIEIPDAIQFAGALVDAGANTLNVTGGVYGSDPFNLLMPFDGQEFLPLAAAIRARVAVPVTGVGNIRFPADAGRAVAAGLCDMVGVGRAVMADPDWALKATGQLAAPIRPCIGTLDGCSERLRHFEPAACQVNPGLGRESMPQLEPATPRRVTVVGSGPAGCDAATVAAARGHQVTLIERGATIGGTLRLLAGAPGGEPFGWLADHFEQELARLGVQVDLGRTLDRREVGELDCDHLIVATGGVSEIPSIPGIDCGIAVGAEDVLGDPDLTAGSAVVIGSGRRGIYVALALQERGARVVIVDQQGTGIARDASALMRRQYRRELARRSIREASCAVTSISPTGVQLADGTQLAADLVVAAVAGRSDRLDVKALDPDTVQVVGDAKSPRSVMDAIEEAHTAVLAIP
ncbi:MAG: FAD-dependent oxidoreductase [Nostocoides sp.]